MRARLALSVAAVASLVAGVGVTADASIRQPSVVGTNPADFTPHLADDSSGIKPRVLALAQLGGRIYIGGIFRKVASPKLEHTKHRRNVAAFDADTGAFSGFAPNVTVRSGRSVRSGTPSTSAARSPRSTACRGTAWPSSTDGPGGSSGPSRRRSPPAG